MKQGSIQTHQLKEGKISSARCKEFCEKLFEKSPMISYWEKIVMINITPRLHTSIALSATMFLKVCPPELFHNGQV
jgi:hypothetical protein